METNKDSASNLHRRIVLVKFTKNGEPIIPSCSISANQIIVPKNNGSHNNLGFRKSKGKSTTTFKPRRVVESSRTYYFTNQPDKNRKIDLHHTKPKNRRVVWKQKEY